MLLLEFYLQVPQKKFKQVLSRPTRPTCLTCLTRPTCPSPPSLLNPLTRPTCPTIQNSKFKIHNLPIPFALFRVHYRLKKRLSL